MALPQNTTTVEGFISAGQNISISYSKLSFLETLDNGTIVPIYNVISDYIDEIKDASESVQMTDTEYKKYCYKPKMLCLDIYGNTEVDFIILLINDIADVKEFSKQTLLLPTAANLTSILTSIYNAEKSAIEEYNS